VLLIADAVVIVVRSLLMFYVKTEHETALIT